MTSNNVGEIRRAGFNYVPQDWLPCDGSLQSISAVASAGAAGRRCLSSPALRQTRAGILAGLDPPLVAMLLSQQFAGQSMTYRARFPGACFDVAEHDGMPIGRIVVNRTDDEIRLVDIALLEAWRGRGIGTRLLSSLFETATASRLPVVLSVASDNPTARRLYERLGFVATNTGPIDIEMRWAAWGGSPKSADEPAPD